MNSRIVLFFIFSVFAITSYAQDAKKMAKNLKVVTTENFDKTASISFDRKNPQKHGFEDISAMFKNAFVSNKFSVKGNPRFLLVMDYDYGYVIAAYRFQYSNLTAEILDLENNRAVVATIIYKGRFEIDAVADAVAVELARRDTPANVVVPEKEVIAPETPPPAKVVVKTKEEKLVELKQFYEKQLITKEEYEEQKKKVLAE
jgi:hypothetical protein